MSAIDNCGLAERWLPVPRLPDRIFLPSIMPPTMRVLTQKEKTKRLRDEQREAQRQTAVELMGKSSHSLRKVSAMSGVPYSACRLLKHCVDNGNMAILNKLLKPAKHRAGGRSHLYGEQEQMISERLMFAQMLRSKKRLRSERGGLKEPIVSDRSIKWDTV